MTARLGGRGGRERVGAGGVADAAWSGESTSEVRLDHDELKEMATTEFAPPEGITPAMGGIILAESVQQIGRASCRERVCQYVSISVVAVSLEKKKERNGKKIRNKQDD